MGQQGRGETTLRQHSCLGCYEIRVYCTAAGDDYSVATGEGETGRRPQTKVAFVGATLGENNETVGKLH